MRTRTAATSSAAASGSKARQDLVRYLDIRVHVPYILEPLERLEQVHHRLRVIPESSSEVAARRVTSAESQARTRDA